MDVGLTTPKGSKVRTELWMEQGIRLYIYPIVLLTGLTGNTLSIAILTRPAMRSLPTYTYLTLLSFTDNLVLLAHLLRLWIEALTGYDISLQHNWACKLKSLVGFTTTHYSGWLIVAMTVDRYMAVCRPLQASCHGEKKRKTFLVVTLLFIFFLFTNIHFLWTNHLVPSVIEKTEWNSSAQSFSPTLNVGEGPLNEHTTESDSLEEDFPQNLRATGMHLTAANVSSSSEDSQHANFSQDDQLEEVTRYICDNFEEYKVFYEYVWPWIDSTLHCWAPFIILSVLNFIIATKVADSRKTRGKLTNNRLACSNSISENSKNLGTPSTVYLSHKRSFRDEERGSNVNSFRIKGQNRAIAGLHIEESRHVKNHYSILKKTGKKTSIVMSLNSFRFQKSKADNQEIEQTKQPLGHFSLKFKDNQHDMDNRSSRNLASNTRQTSKRSKVDGELRLTIMLLVVSFTFLLTTLPVNAFMIVKTLLYENEVNDDLEDRLMLWQTICDLLMYSNHAINFFLYCATGAKFRRQLFLAISKLGR